MPTVFAAFEDRLRRHSVEPRSAPGEPDTWTDEKRSVTGEPGPWTGETVLEGKALDAIAAHPGIPDRILVGTIEEGVHRSQDGGDTWERVGRQRIDDHVTALASDPSEPERFYVGTEPSRVSVTTDGGDAWHHLEGLSDLPSATSWAFPPRPSTHHVRWIEVAPQDPAHLYVAIEAGALVRSFDGGETWVDRVSGGRRDTHTMATHPDVPGRAWTAAGDGFAVTDDAGDTWRYPQSGLDHRYCWSVAVDPADPDRLLLSAADGPRAAHTSGAAESYVYGRNAEDQWTLAGDGLPHGAGMLRPVMHRGFEPGVVYLATNIGIWRTGNMGERWEEIHEDWPAALESQTVRGVAVV